MRSKRSAVFLDKDGTLVHDVPYNVDPAMLTLTPHAVDGLKLLQAKGHMLVVVTNQPGVAMGLFDGAALDRLAAALVDVFAREGVHLQGFFACPHSPEHGCDCRKPADGLLRRAAKELQLDLRRSWMVGDILNDVEAGHRAGCRSVLLDVGNETEWLRSPLRKPDLVAANLLEAGRCILAVDSIDGSEAT